MFLHQHIFAALLNRVCTKYLCTQKKKKKKKLFSVLGNRLDLR